jgi:hypothetical protein
MSTRSISLAVLAVSLIVIAFLALCGESEETRRAREKQAEDARRAERQHKTTREENCRLVTEALGIVEARGRGDLAAPKGRIEACRRLVIEDCDYKVELQYELTNASSWRAQSNKQQRRPSGETRMRPPRKVTITRGVGEGLYPHSMRP